MTEHDRAALMLLALAAALLAWWLYRRDRDTILVPGVGRVKLESNGHVRDAWREKYAPPEEWYDGN